MIKKIVAFLFLVLISNIQIAQNLFKSDYSQFPKEKIFVHTNNNFFITGEQILYALHCLNTKDNTPSKLSKIAYLEIINKNNKSIEKQKIILKNGIGSGDLFIKSSVKTGTYKIVAYTQWMRNEQVFFEETIYIVNPFSNKLTKNTTANSNTSVSKNSTNRIKKAYEKREKVIFPLSENEFNNASISIRRINDLNISESINSKNIILKNKTNLENIKVKYLPELRGQLFHGKISSANKNVSNKKIGISFIGDNKITIISNTNKNGDFYFNVDKNYSANKVIIEVLEEKNINYDITLVNNKPLNKKFTNFKPLVLNESLRKHIKEKSKFTQVENAYALVKKDRNYPEKQNNSIFYKNNNNIRYNLDDYARFKTIKEVTVEILQDVWLEKKKNRYEFKLRDINLESSNTLKTLLIVDGFIINNHNSFMDFDALKIESITLVKEKYNYGANLYQGIINIKTYKNDFVPKATNAKEFILLKPSQEKKYYQPNYSSNSLENIPDFRTQLYWNPSLKKHKNITFFTSDVSGDYRIEIQGFSENGKPIYKEVFFTVK